MIRPWCLLLIFLGLWRVPAAARAEDPDPRQLLSSALANPPSYHGVRSVVTWSARGESSAVEVREIRRGRRVRMEFQPTPNARLRLMMSSAEGWMIQEPGRGWTEYAVTCARLAEQRLLQAFQSYRWHVLGEDVVAGRPTLILAAEPTYPGGLRHRFWVDPEHRVVLRREKFTPEGQLIYASTFLDIRFPERVDLPLPPRIRVRSPRATGAPSVPFATRLPAPPSGFVQEGMTPLQGESQPGLQVVYSDGLECFSLFQFSGAHPIQMFGAVRRRLGGASILARPTAYGNLISWSDGERCYALMSSLPTEAVAPVVENLAPSTRQRKGLLYYLKRGLRRLATLVATRQH